MLAPYYLLALDQGTTSSRAVLYSDRGEELRTVSVPLACRFPQDGWVEQDPEEIFTTQAKAAKDVVEGIDPKQILAIGLTNQRETTIAWDRRSGQALAPAIVWQCRRSAEICERLRAYGHEGAVREKTGLVVDAYFSATKIMWLLEHIPGLREKAAEGSAVFGTVDSWLLYKLTALGGEPVFRTEPSNASRTMLYRLQTGNWDEELLEICGISAANLAEIRPSAGELGRTTLLGPSLPVTGMLGDQQASLLGHGCTEADTVKCTFGTGAFLLLNTGGSRRHSSSGLISSVAWSRSAAEAQYVLEGSIFIAGALIQWLRDELGLISSSAESEVRARRVQDSGSVVIVPAFVGLGAPYWDQGARGAILGLTRDSGADHLVRASLEAVAHQTADITESAEFENTSALKIDGGMVVNSLFCQVLADLTGLAIEVAATPEITALGAARIAFAGLSPAEPLADACTALAAATKAEPVRYTPQLSAAARQAKRRQWQEAVARVRS